MKTYFRYEDTIKSKEAAEAIAAPVGLGPFCGFGSGVIKNNTDFILYPKTFTGDKFSSNVIDRIRARYMVKESGGELPDINFGCISRDGYIYISDEPSMSLGKIQGSQGSTQEVLVFAIHTPIAEPVDNPVSFIAYWNEGSESFYDLFKRSQDPYYPEASANRSPSISSALANAESEFNYSNLDDLAMNACSYYKSNLGSAVLIGIYGTGMDAMSRRQEDFAIVPYNGKFREIPFTTSIYGSFKESISKLEELTHGFPSTLSNQALNIKAYIDAQVEILRKEITESKGTSVLPIGSIILWESDTIPEGWNEYTKASGRIVLGYQAGGITLTEGEVILANIGDYYNPIKGQYVINITAEDVPRHQHSMGANQFKADGGGNQWFTRPENFKNRDGNYTFDRGDERSNDVYKGTLLSSFNLDPNAADYRITESSKSTVALEKLPPTITLRYIQKIS